MNFKKLAGTFILFCFILSSVSPSYAILAKKNKKPEVSKLDYINLPWWQEYNDEYLEEYILKAINNNQDLKIATLKVEAARQNVKAQFASELPQIGVAASPAVVKMPYKTSTEGVFSIPMIASYEIDIFLKNHDKTKSVKKLYEASKYSEQATYIAVASAVGATYYNIVKADELIRLQEKITQDRKQIFDLMKIRNEEGITSTADLTKAEKSYILADCDLTELKRVRNNLLTSLAILIGDSADNIGEYKRISYSDLKIQKKVPKEISSEIITNRPDYLISAKMVEKAGIDVRVAKKEFLPTFNIGGFLALITSSTMNTMSWETALAGAGINGILPIFTGGKRIAYLKINKNKYEQALQEYQKTNLTAIKEINDALNDLKFDDEKYRKNLNALNMEKSDYKFAEDKYKEGVISYLDLIQKKEVLLSTEKLVVASNIDAYVNQIGLYKATAGANL